MALLLGDRVILLDDHPSRQVHTPRQPSDLAWWLTHSRHPNICDPKVLVSSSVLLHPRKADYALRRFPSCQASVRIAVDRNYGAPNKVITTPILVPVFSFLFIFYGPFMNDYNLGWPRSFLSFFLSTSTFFSFQRTVTGVKGVDSL